MNPLEQIITYLESKQEYETAYTCLLTFFKYTKQNPTIQELDLLGRLFYNIKKYPEAIEATEYALTIAGTKHAKFSSRCNLIKLYNHTNQPEKALTYISVIEYDFPLNQKIAKMIELNNFETLDFSLDFNLDMLFERVFSYFLLNDKEKSEKILRLILSNKDSFNLSPENISRAKFNLGTYDLYNGKFQEGLQGFMLEGKKIGLWQKSNFDETNLVTLDKPIMQGDKILVIEEAGIGDSFMNIRFMKELDKRNIKYVWLTSRQDLYNIYLRNGFNVILSLKDLPDLYSNYRLMYSMSAPIHLNLQLDNLWSGKYILPRITDKAMTSNTNKLKIGLRWGGNILYEHDLHRSIPLKELFNNVYEKYPDAEFYSLQVGDGEEQLEDFPQIRKININDYDDTLSLIHELDLVVTTCTSIVHAAGSMGVNTCVFVPISAYYCWASMKETDSTFNYWYPSVKVFRQTKVRSWNEPFKQFKEYKVKC